MTQTITSPLQALAIAEAVFNSRYAGAMFGFAAGSIFRGEGTYHSDLDLVVVYDHLAAARRESFVVHGLPVESFVHDSATLEWFIDADIERGRPSILNMIAEGTIVGGLKDRAIRVQDDVKYRLSSGPPRMDFDQLNALRYEITEAIDDLRGERTPSEIMAIGAMLHSRVVELCLRNRGRWHGTGKWGPRLLVNTDPALAARFELAFRNLFVSSSCAAVLTFVEDELDVVGGRLFDGDQRVAPASCRK